MDRRVWGLGGVFTLVLAAMLGNAQLARTGGPPVCGNAVLEDGEECDDGTLIAGDGCNGTCLIEGPLSKTQQGCVNGMNAAFSSAITAANAASRRCVNRISKGTVGGTFPQCFGGTDFTQSATKASTIRANRCVAKGVVPANTFAYTGDPDALLGAALEETLAAHVDLLGNPAAIAPTTAAAAARCQKTFVKGYAKYLNALAKHTNKATRASLKDKLSPPLTSLELQTDLAVAAGSPKVAAALSILKTKAAAKCSGQVLATLFPGACTASSASAAALGDCAGQLGRCRYCLALNEADHLQLDCEDYSGLAVCPPPGPVCGDGDLEPGEDCDDANTVDDDGCDGLCQDEICGNGIVQTGSGEECDDGDTISGDGCSATCLMESCGNQTLQKGEDCDDGNTLVGDGCAACRFEECGNGLLQFGEDCDDGNTVSGDNCSATCDDEFCGDGVTQPGQNEECDDGNTISGDGCSATCASEGCGNGVLNPQEDCDDGNTVPGDGCDATCDFEVCGNDEVQAAEQCDDGNTASGDGCTALCQTELCGDGVTQGGLGEECDDTNTVDGDGCDATCDLEICGNGELQFGEQCDDSNTAPGDGCDATCDLEVCGNAEVQVGEQCDDGNTASGDGCSAICQNELCGDGVTQGGLGEECDDTNTVNGDGCDATCDLEICGNGELQFGEQCDDSNTAPGDGCDATCDLEVCGNAEVQVGEQCDDGNTASGDGCSAICQNELCGDGVTQGGLGEECDDTNTVNGDGCDATCDLEICGNGELQFGEQCDDSNTAPGDGCDATCDLEVCGNAEVQVGEQCDDGNTASGDGCSAICQNELCGDGAVQAGEECDDSNTVSGDGCSAICQNEVAVCPSGTAPVYLGAAGNFAMLTQTGITTTGATSIVGDIGVSPIASGAMTGFGEVLDGSGEFAISGLVDGRMYAADYAAPTPAYVAGAVGDLGTAYANAAARVPDFTDLSGGAIGGLVLVPGVYKFNGAVTIASNLTLVGGADDVWIFQLASTLGVSDFAEILLLGGAQPNNVFWQVTGQTNLGGSSKFKGIILDATAIIFGSGATLDGRALAQTAATMIGNVVTKTPSPGVCWTLGGIGESCATACLDRGRAYDDATRTVAGSAGTLAQCEDVADALTSHGAVSDSGVSCTAGLGCTLDATTDVVRCLDPATDAEAFHASLQRFCACAQP